MVSTAFTGQTFRQCSQATHLLSLNVTFISGLFISRAPVGQNTEHAPHWVHLDSFQIICCCRLYMCNPIFLSHSTAPAYFSGVPETSITMRPSLRGLISALNMFTFKSYFFTSEYITGSSTISAGYLRTIFSLTFPWVMGIPPELLIIPGARVKKMV